MPDLKLYYRPLCPFCGKVLTYMKENNIELPLIDISSSEQNRQELEKMGGKTQVPCLFIDGSPLYESDDIIQWLAKSVQE